MLRSIFLEIQTPYKHNSGLDVAVVSFGRLVHACMHPCPSGPDYTACSFSTQRRKSSLAADDGHLDLEPGWMRRKSILNSPNGDIKRRLSSAVNLPLPEDELVRPGCS